MILQYSSLELEREYNMYNILRVMVVILLAYTIIILAYSELIMKPIAYLPYALLLIGFVVLLDINNEIQQRNNKTLYIVFTHYDTVRKALAGALKIV